MRHLPFLYVPAMVVSLVVGSEFAIGEVPQLIVPDRHVAKSEQGIVGRFGARQFRHGVRMLHEVSPTTDPPGGPFFSPDGQTIYVASRFSLAAINVNTGEPRFHYRYSLWNLAVRNAGSRGIFVHFHQGPLTGMFVLLEHGTGRELGRWKTPVINGQNGFYTFADNQRHLLRTKIVTGPAPETMKGFPPEPHPQSPGVALYHAPTKKTLLKTISSGWSRSEIVATNESRLVVSSSQEVAVFATKTGKKLRSFPLNLDKNNKGRSVARVSSDGERVYAWRRQNEKLQLVMFEVETGRERILAHDERKKIFSSPVVSPDESLLAYQMDDFPWKQNAFWRIIQLDDLSQAHIVDVRPEVTSAAFSSDSQSFWLRSRWGLAKFDLTTGKFDPASLESLTTPQQVSLSSDGTRLFEVSGAELRTWNTKTGEEAEPRRRFENRIRDCPHARCIDLSRDGRKTIWAARIGDGHLHPAVDGRITEGTYTSNSIPGRDFRLTLDQRHIIYHARLGDLNVGEFWSGQPLRQLIPAHQPRHEHRMAIAPDNRTLAVTHGDYHSFRKSGKVEIELWDIHSGQRTGGMHQVGSDQMAMQFSRDSQSLRVWHRGTRTDWSIPSGIQLRRFRNHDTAVRFTTPNRHWFFRRAHLVKSSGQLELVELNTLQVARRWKCEGAWAGQFCLTDDRRKLAVTTGQTPILMYDFYDVRPDCNSLKHYSIKELIDELDIDDAKAAFDAMCELIRRGDGSIPELQQRLSLPPLREAELDLLLDQSASRYFEARQKATRQFSEASVLIVPLLVQKQALATSLEQKARIEDILAIMRSSPLQTSDRRAFRGVEVLFAIHSEASRKALVDLADGEPLSPATSQAKAALTKWGRCDE